MKEQRYRERPTLTDRFMCFGKLPRILGNWYGQVINMSGIKGDLTHLQIRSPLFIILHVNEVVKL